MKGTIQAVSLKNCSVMIGEQWYNVDKEVRDKVQPYVAKLNKGDDVELILNDKGYFTKAIPLGREPKYPDNEAEPKQSQLELSEETMPEYEKRLGLALKIVQKAFDGIRNITGKTELSGQYDNTLAALIKFTLWGK